MAETRDRASGLARRLNIGGMPSAPTSLLLAALALGAAIVAASLYTIGALRAALLQNGVAGGLVSGVAMLLAVASFLIALPLSRAFIGWRDVRRAIERDDVVGGRAARFQAQGLGWIALGYVFAQFVVVVLAWFLLANHQAIPPQLVERISDNGVGHAIPLS